jgi:hypothetical protein
MRAERELKARASSVFSLLLDQKMNLAGDDLNYIGCNIEAGAQ